MPVPAIIEAVRPCSRNRRRTAGVMRGSSPPRSGASVAAGAGGAAVAAARWGWPSLGLGLGVTRGWRGRGGRALGRGSAAGALGSGSMRPARSSARRRRAAHRGGRLGAAGRRAAGCRLVLGLDDRDLGVVGDGCALLDEDLAQDAGEGRGHLGVDLVGDDLEEGLVLGDSVARLLEPLADRALSDTLAELGHRHLGHGSVLLARDAARRRRGQFVAVP